MSALVSLGGESAATPIAAPRNVAVASCKGGVGKSFLALNLAWALGELGQRVLLVELDADAGALSVAAGLGELPAVRPARDAQELASRVVAVPGTANVHLVRAADLAPTWIRTPSALDSVLATAAASLRIQWRIFDMAPGVSGPAVMWFGRADHAVLIGTPELVTVQAMLRFHKHAKYQHAFECLLHLEPALRACGPSLKAAKEQLFAMHDAERAHYLWDRALHSLRMPRWVFNRCLPDDDAQLARIRSYLANHVGSNRVSPNQVVDGSELPMATIPEDTAQLRCARYGRVLLRHESASPAARAIRQLADGLLADTLVADAQLSDAQLTTSSATAGSASSVRIAELAPSQPTPHVRQSVACSS